MPDGTRKDDGIFIRLTEKEKKALQRAASDEERTIADWARLLFRKRLRELGLLKDDETAGRKTKKEGLAQ